MATGSGKTMAMSLCIVWSYFHARARTTRRWRRLPRDRAERDRLRAAEERLRRRGTFRRDPLIPPEWARGLPADGPPPGRPAPITTRGALFLPTSSGSTSRRRREEEQPIPTPSRRCSGRASTATWTALGRGAVRADRDRDRVMVVNDEAHHVWSEKLKWNQSIERLHDELRRARPRTRAGVVAQLDFSATPKDQKGRALPARRRRLPARPGGRGRDRQDAGDRRGVAAPRSSWAIHVGAAQPALDRRRRRALAQVRRGAFAVGQAPGAVRHVREHAGGRRGWRLPAPAPDFAGDKLLVIHTNRSGEITKADLDLARRAAREVDGHDSRIRCIVSVLMLREGWDVRNVCVIVTLRTPDARKRRSCPSRRSAGVCGG